MENLRNSPVGTWCPWEISIRSPLRETSQRPLRNISEKIAFLRRLPDISKTSKKDVLCVTSLRCLEPISKKMSFPWRLYDVLKTSLASICDFSKKYPTKMVSCDFRRVITIFEKIDFGLLEKLKKYNISGSSA